MDEAISCGTRASIVIHIRHKKNNICHTIISIQFDSLALNIVTRSDS